MTGYLSYAFQILLGHIQSVALRRGQLDNEYVPEKPCKFIYETAKLTSLPHNFVNHIYGMFNIRFQHALQKSCKCIYVHSSYGLKHIIICKLLSEIECNALIQNRQGISHGTIAGFCDIIYRLLIRIKSLPVHKLLQSIRDDIHRDTSEVVLLTP